MAQNALSWGYTALTMDEMSNPDVVEQINVHLEGPSANSVIYENEQGLARPGDQPPLHIACARCDVAWVNAELASAGSLSKRDERDVFGWVPLHYAAAAGASAICRALGAHGAFLDARGPGGQTPLHCAAAGNEPEVIVELCAQRASTRDRGKAAADAR